MSLDIQRQIMENANKTRDELTHLASWLEEIQKRDSELLELKKQGKFGYIQPKEVQRPNRTKEGKVEPVRVQVQSTPEPSLDTKEKKESNNETSSSATSDKVDPNQSFATGTKPHKTYDDWAKIDAKLKQMEADDDKDEEKTTKPSETKKPAQAKKDENPKVTAENHKLEGNKLYTKKDFKGAIKEYTIAIQLQPSNAVYYFNRSTAQFQLSAFTECERDATKAISLDPRYAKAFMRRGLAREALGKLQSAVEDLETALKLEPKLEIAQKKLPELRTKLGISPDGHIQEIVEPQTKIIEEVEIQHEPPAPTPPPEPRRGPKIEIIEEHTLNENIYKPEPKKVQIISEEEPKKVSIVSEEPKKVSIVSEEEPQKVKIISEEEPKKVSIVSEEPQKVRIISEEPQKQEEPKKVSIVSEEPEKKKGPKLLTTYATLEAKKEAEKAQMEAKKEESPKKKGPRPVPIQIIEDEEPKKEENRFKNVPWIEMEASEIPERLAVTPPNRIAKQIGSDITDDLLINFVAGVASLTDPANAFQYLAAFSKKDEVDKAFFPKEVWSQAKTNAQKIIAAYEEVPSKDEKVLARVKKTWGVK